MAWELALEGKVQVLEASIALFPPVRHSLPGWEALCSYYCQVEMFGYPIRSIEPDGLEGWPIVEIVMQSAGLQGFCQ